MPKTATVHNPTNFEPKDYEVENYLDNRRPVYCGGHVADYEKEVHWWEHEMSQTFGPDWRAKVNHCVHCGNGSVRWITAVRHIPTGEVVVFGATCTERLGFADRFAFKLAQLQARDTARKVRFTIWNRRQEFLKVHPEVFIALNEIDKPIHAGNRFAKDVLSKLDQYGSLSPRQVECVISSLARDHEYAAKKAVEAAEEKGLAPEGRITVVGIVLSVQERETDFGIVHKMLVKLDNNAKVWASVPRGYGINRNDIVAFTATWKPSDTDKSFAFGSRPHLVKHLPANTARSH